MKKVLLTIAYNGTAYEGYQLQNDRPTIALVLNNATKDAFGFECDVTGCSRTDSGVHALGFMATVEPRNKNDEITVPVDKIPIAMNIKLPNDVSVLDAKEVPCDFHPRYDVLKKEYIYKINIGEYNPIEVNHILQYNKTLHINKMNSALKLLEGEHDFSSFTKIQDEK